MLTVLAFIAALALLIAVHEYGHYRMAVACGVRVLRFSIGFGKPLWCWKSPVSGTEFVLALFPFGGFVKMLDERESPVEASLRHLAFNVQPLHRRVAIVAAGPLANLTLAVVLYACVHWIGIEQPAPILAQPAPDSLASQAGLQGGERVLRAGIVGAELTPMVSFEDFRWLVTHAVLESSDIELVVKVPATRQEASFRLKLSGLDVREVDAQLLDKIGIHGPFSAPTIGDVMADGAAAKAGLHRGDVVLKMAQQPIVDAQQLRRLIRLSAGDAAATAQPWQIQRQGKTLELMVQPARVSEGGQVIGRIGAYVGAPPELTLIHYGVGQGVSRAVVKTWDVSALTLNMLGKMLLGQASIKNISGPLTIADYAGRSASMGLTQYLTFLALISVSLGVLNLLPLPMLDGGHLMYYLWEGMTGRPVSDAWMEKLQRVGVVVLGVLMLIALYNDIMRFFGR